MTTEPIPSEVLDEVSCVICGNPVDTVEIEDGGSPDGCQLNDGRWVCTRECYDAPSTAYDQQGR